MIWFSQLKSEVTKSIRFIGPNGMKWMLAGVLGTIILGFVELGIASFIPIFLKTVGLTDANLIDSSSFPVSALPSWAVGGGLIALGFIRFLGQYLVSQSGTHMQEALSNRLRKLLNFRILLHSDQSFTAASESHYLLGSVFQPASSGAYLIAMSVASGLQALILIGLMIATAWKEAFLGLLGLSLIGVAVLRINKSVRARAAKVLPENKSLVTGIERVARNWLLVRILRTQRLEHDRFFRNIEVVTKNSLGAASLSNLAWAGTPLFGIVLLVIIVSVSQTYWTTAASVLLSFLYLFIRFVQGLSGTVNSISRANQYFPQFQEAANFFFRSSEAHVDAALKGIGSAPESIFHRGSQSPAPAISFCNVDFAYGDMNIIKNLTLDVSSGSTLGIIGPSGSGKSTLLLLMLGILPPRSGKIHVGGVDARCLLQNEALRVGYVGPEPFLFAGTIRDNLIYGLTDTEDEQLWQALLDAQLFSQVKSMPGQLAHYIAENGDGLSAGQKQRLCLARVFLRRPSLIVLDEATANLDIKTEIEVVDSLAKLKGKSTIIIVTHRESALRHADRVFDLNCRKLISSPKNSYQSSELSESDVCAQISPLIN